MRPLVEHDDPVAQAVEQVGLVLDDEQRGPARGQLAKGLADQPRAFRIELGRRLVEDEVRRPHRQQRGDDHELALAARQAARLALREVVDAERRQGGLRPARRSRAAVKPRFIGPSATSSNTEPVTPDSWVAGFWKPIPTRVENSYSGLPAMGSPSMDSPPPVSAPPIEPGARPEATRHSVDLPASLAPTTRRSRRRQGSGRCRGGPAWRSRRSDTPTPARMQHRASDRPLDADAAAATTSSTTRSPAEDALPAACRASPTGGGADRVG